MVDARRPRTVSARANNARRVRFWAVSLLAHGVLLGAFAELRSLIPPAPPLAVLHYERPDRPPPPELPPPEPELPRVEEQVEPTDPMVTEVVAADPTAEIDQVTEDLRADRERDVARSMASAPTVGFPSMSGQGAGTASSARGFLTVRKPTPAPPPPEPVVVEAPKPEAPPVPEPIQPPPPLPVTPAAMVRLDLPDVVIERWRGTLEARIELDAKGKVISVEITKGTGVGAWDKQVAEAFRRAEYRAARRGDESISSVLLQEVRQGGRA